MQNAVWVIPTAIVAAYLCGWAWACFEEPGPWKDEWRGRR